MPLAQSRAADVNGHRLWDVASLIVQAGAPKAKLDVLQIRFKPFVEQTHSAKEFGAEQAGGSRREPDAARRREFGTVWASVAYAPGAAAPAERVISAVNQSGLGC